MEQTERRSNFVAEEIQSRITMFPQEGGTSCDHRVTAIALVTLAALTNFLFFSTVIGIGLSLLSLGLIIWVLTDRCSSIDWDNCGERKINITQLFRTTHTPPPPPARQRSYGSSSFNLSSPPIVSQSSTTSNSQGARVALNSTPTPLAPPTLEYRVVTKTPETAKRTRVPTPNAPPALSPPVGSQSFKPAASPSVSTTPIASQSLTTSNSQGARVALNSTPTPLALSSLENRVISKAPETVNKTRVPTPNAPPVLSPPVGSQLFKPGAPNAPINYQGGSGTRVAIGGAGSISPNVLPFLASKIPEAIHR